MRLKRRRQKAETRPLGRVLCYGMRRRRRRQKAETRPLGRVLCYGMQRRRRRQKAETRPLGRVLCYGMQRRRRREKPDRQGGCSATGCSEGVVGRNPTVREGALLVVKVRNVTLSIQDIVNRPRNVLRLPQV